MIKYRLKVILNNFYKDTSNYTKLNLLMSKDQDFLSKSFRKNKKITMAYKDQLLLLDLDQNWNNLEK